MKILLFLTFSLFCFSSLGQYKIVKIDCEKKYFRFFYKSKMSEEKGGDSIFYRLITISDSSFYFERHFKKSLFKDSFQIYAAKDSLNVRVRSMEADGRYIIKSKKEHYYLTKPKEVKYRMSPQ